MKEVTSLWFMGSQRVGHDWATELNQSVVSRFIFLGLCDLWELQAFLLVISYSLYLITILGNIFTVLLIIADVHLYSPMYFVLVNLSFIALCLSSVTTPKLISDFLKANKTISIRTCMCQIFFFWIFFFEGVKFCSLCPWPMTFMWPSASHSITLISWTHKCAFS